MDSQLLTRIGLELAIGEPISSIAIVNDQNPTTATVTVENIPEAGELEQGSSTSHINGKWIPASSGSIPGGALKGGEENVARASHNGDTIPGKLLANGMGCHIPYDRAEHFKSNDYEVLVIPEDNVCWVATIGGNIPSHAIPGGVTSKGETLYIGRVRHQVGVVAIGKVHPSMATCYISYGGREHCYSEYGILVKGQDHLSDANRIDKLLTARKGRTKVIYLQNEGKRPFSILKWSSASNGKIPDGALKAGEDAGRDVFVARAEHGCSTVPGKLLANGEGCLIPWGRGEHSKTNYEVLVIPDDQFRWMETHNGNIPANAIPGGVSEAGETLYIGRVQHKANVTCVGKVHPSKRFCYVSYDGREHCYSDYEILTMSE